MNAARRFVFPLTLLLLAACGQKTNTPPGSESPSADKPYTQVGLVLSSNGFTSAGVQAKFVSIAGGTALSSFSASNPTPLDTCQLGSIPGAFTQFTSLYTSLISNNNTLNAGDALTFKKNGMTFASVPRMDIQPQATPNSSYLAQNLTLSGLSNLTLSIPGAAGGFPAFTDVPFAVPNPAFSLKTPSDLNAATPTTVFTWTGASNDSGAAVLIGVKQSDTLSFFCTARDDGSFTIPSDFQDVLRAQKFTKGTAAAIQRLSQLKTSGKALLVLQSFSGVGL